MNRLVRYWVLGDGNINHERQGQTGVQFPSLFNVYVVTKEKTYVRVSSKETTTQDGTSFGMAGC